MGHIGDVTLGFDLDCCSATCCCAGQGCVRQSVAGEGTAFLSAMGTILKRTLAEGEVLIVDTEAVVAWDATAKLGFTRVGNCFTCCCGGEGCCNTTLTGLFLSCLLTLYTAVMIFEILFYTPTGPGEVYLQSYSMGKFSRAVMMAAQGGGGGAGSAGGGPMAGDEMTR